MSSVETLGSIFAVALMLNVMWEFLHARLYVTSVTRTYLVWQSVKDAIWITLAYLIAPTVVVFALVLIAFAYVVELHAIHTKRWEYAKEMPRIFGVGLSPLFELALTGLLTLYLLGLW